MTQLIRDKFTELLLFVALILLFALWTTQDFRQDLSYYVFGLFTAFLTSVGMRPRPNTIQADNIETAKTQTGDIVGGTIQNKEREP